MGIIKCENGHFFDDLKYKKCPHCEMEEKKSASINNEEKTVAKISVDRKRNSLASFVAGDEERTVGIFSSKGTFLPVVGWLVCIEGVEKGRDYRIASGRNFIGRAYQMDITISDDQEISKENHCSVIYDPKSFKFTLAPGSSISYINGEEVRKPVELRIYDKISLGKTVLQFVPYCKEGVSW